MNKIQSIFRFLFRRAEFESDLDSELREHKARLIEQNVSRGMTPEEARRQAVATMGGVEPLKEECRDARRGRVIEALAQDVRYGLRVLRKNPGFSLAAIVTLALGIGANTAIFSVVYGVLLRPLPYSHGEQLMVLHQNAPQAHAMDFPFSVKEIEDYRSANHTLQGVVEHHTMNFLLIGKDTAERVDTAVVSANFFDVLGVKPLLGRTFVADDDVVGGPAVLILTHKYWQTHQGGDPNIVGKVFRMNNRAHKVIGVLPPFPQYPAEVDVYMPTSQCPTRSSASFISNRNARMMTVFCRRKPNMTAAQVQADVAVVGKNIAAANQDIYRPADGYTVDATPLETDLTSRARMMFLVLLGVAGFVLLIACANVANLLLARLLKLEREFAVRAALGAGRMRLVRQVLTESLLVSLGGGALGLALAPASLALLVKFAGRFTTRANEVTIDAPVLLFTLGVSLATGIVFGLAPAISSGHWISEGFQQGGRTTGTIGRQRLRGALVVAQVAVSVILLAGAGLMIRSFLKLQGERPGFSPERILTLRMTPGFPPYTFQTVAALGDRILEKMRTLPGVTSFAMASNYPFNPSGVVTGPAANQFDIEDRPQEPGRPVPVVDARAVSPNYFTTIGQPIVAGRGFVELDAQKDSPSAAVINEAMAHHYWPNENPIGKKLSLDGRKTWSQVVGVAGNVREFRLAPVAIDELYISYQQGWVPRLLVRTAMDPEREAGAVREAIRQIDPLVAVDQVTTIEKAEYDSMASPRTMAMLLGIFAGLAVVISGGGIAAVMALAVSQRRREIGVRMALGAKRRSIVGMIMRSGFGLAVVGTALGIAGAILVTKVLAAFLYGVSPTDATTLAGVSVVFLIVAAAACFVPARQATSIDPMIALREE